MGSGLRLTESVVPTLLKILTIIKPSKYKTSSYCKNFR